MSLQIVRRALELVRGSPLNRYLALVVVPTVLVLFYQGLIASDGYVSRAQVMVEHDASTVAAAAQITLGMLSIGGQRNKLDALVVEAFMRSRSMLENLDEEFDLRGHFSADRVDILSRLSADASAEDFYEYYLDRVNTAVDEQTYVVDIEFVAYDAEYARKVNRSLVSRAETFVNEVGHYLAREQLEFVAVEVERANEKLKIASREMIELQRHYDVFSPQQETEAAGVIIAGLMQELSKQRIELKSLTTYLSNRAPEVVTSAGRVRALEEQIAKERSKLVGADGEGLNDVMLAYQDAQVNLTLATEVYKAALGTLEATRLDAARKVKYLVSLSSPTLPDSAERPRVAYWTFTAFILLNLLYFVFTLIVATVQDHRE